MTRRLADLTNGGLSLKRGMEILESQTQNVQMKSLIAVMGRDLRLGKSFSQTLSSQGKIFNSVYIGIIRAGESSGSIDGALQQLAELLEVEIDTKQRLRAAFTYPIILLAMAILVCLFLTVFVIPRFEFLFQDLGQRLPLPTRILLGFSMFIKKVGWLIMLLAVGGVTVAIKKNPDWIPAQEARLMQIPWLRNLIQSAGLQRWAHVMASLLRSGLPVADALQLSRHSFGRRFYSNELGIIIKNVLEGRSLAAALGASSLFPPLIAELVGAGEESGRLEQTFSRLADNYRRESELIMKLFLSLLEPALILTMGLVVGFVAIAMLLPIFEMSANLR